MMNPEIDCLFFVDARSFERICCVRMVGGGEDRKKIRRIAVPLACWEALIDEKEISERTVLQILVNFPGLEEIVLAVKEASDRDLVCGDLELARLEWWRLPKSPALRRWTRGVFRPWKVYAHLFSVVMVEEAVRVFVGEVLRRYRRRLTSSWEEIGHVDSLDEMKAPNFMIREIKSASE